MELSSPVSSIKCILLLRDSDLLNSDLLSVLAHLKILSVEILIPAQIAFSKDTMFATSSLARPLRRLTYSTLKFMRSTCGKSTAEGPQGKPNEII